MTSSEAFPSQPYPGLVTYPGVRPAFYQPFFPGRHPGVSGGYGGPNYAGSNIGQLNNGCNTPGTCNIHGSSVVGRKKRESERTKRANHFQGGNVSSPAVSRAFPQNSPGTIARQTAAVNSQARCEKGTWPLRLTRCHWRSPSDIPDSGQEIYHSSVYQNGPI